MNTQKTIWLVIAMLTMIKPASSQTITGIVNVYTPVIGFECDSAILLVGSTAGFATGNKVLLIQMQGADISTTPDHTYGDFVTAGTCGNYEFNRVRSVSNGKIGLVYKLSRPYDLKGKVQLVFVPEYQDVAITGTVNALPWNGQTGGVIALDVAGALTISGKIDASSVGFRGGQVQDVNTSVYHETAFFYPNDPVLAAQKGEGVAIVLPDHTHGRGKNGNAGGGGNAHNAGGGGGGSAGTGGQGGLEYYNVPNSPSNNTNGLGGDSLYASSSYFAIMGGGGGAGHTNDQVGTSGGHGGGIIFILATNIVSSNGKIMANGEDANIPSTNRNDGQGGGGGGGNIFCRVSTISGPLAIEAKGGKGANCIFHVASQIIGPGGGGGGGKIVLTAPAPFVVPNVSGGLNGIANQNLTNGAMPGATGMVLQQSLWPDSYIPSGALVENRIEFCSGDTVVINHLVFTESGIVDFVIPNSLGCDTIQRYILQSNELTSETRYFNICPGDSLLFANNIYTNPGVYIDTLKGGEGCDTIVLLTIAWKEFQTIDKFISLCIGEHITIAGVSISSEGVYPDTLYSAAFGCDTIRNNHITFHAPIPFLPPDTVICPGSSILLTSPYLYTQWNKNTTGTTLEVQEPGVITAYFVDENGCPGRDTLRVATCCSEQNIYIPNVFSPNDDGLNDDFCVYSTEQCSALEMQVYDRWGELLFKSVAEPLECWNGDFRGKNMPSGVYVCVLLYFDHQTRQTATKSTAFTLIR